MTSLALVLRNPVSRKPRHPVYGRALSEIEKRLEAECFGDKQDRKAENSRSVKQTGDK